MNNQKVLLNLIATRVQNIQKRQNDYVTHKHYFQNLLESNKSFVLLLLVPAFIIGWHEGKKGSTSNRLKQFFKFMSFNFLGIYRTQLINLITKAASTHLKKILKKLDRWHSNNIVSTAN